MRAENETERLALGIFARAIKKQPELQARTLADAVRMLRFREAHGLEEEVALRRNICAAAQRGNTALAHLQLAQQQLEGVMLQVAAWDLAEKWAEKPETIGR